MARKFFIGSVGKPGDGYDEENRKRCIAQNAHIMHEDTKQKGVFNNVKPGDICFLKYQHVIIAFGEVKNVVILTDESLDGWTHYIYVKQWFFYSNDKEHGVSKYGISEHTYGGAGQMATVKQLDPEFGLQKMKEIGGENNQLYKLVKSEYTMNQLNNEITRSLLSNHNLILTGAPGTGKTYLAKQIAQQLIFDEVKGNLTDDEQKQFDEQCGFVQFHPSYDYTDFVEGLRPIQDDNGNVGFERKDGVFKEFCKKALKNTTVISDNFDECWEKLVTKLEDESFIKIPNLSGKGSFCVEMNEIGSGLASRTYEGEYGKGEWIQGKSKFFNKEQLYNIYKGLKGVPLGGHDNYRRAIVNYMKKEFQMVDYYEQGNKENKNFVFIIDEINRGEISKIFGELFFSIDPGYRGKNGKVKTQYQNLIEVGDEFYDGFFVPENVYIIGTMNDIDRSVESMDFAFRRRFAFKEIKADDNIEMLEELGELKDEAIERMKRLNAEISKIEGLSSAYHIGAAYFLKLKNYAGDADGGFENLWNNHLEGLLREYLRGSLNTKESIAKLKAAYNNESPENIG